MSGLKHYAICENECLVETMSKEEILSAIENATGNAVIPANEAFVSMIVNQNDGTNLKLWRGTTAQYNAIEPKAEDTVYIITDEKPVSEVVSEIVTETVQQEMENFLIKSDIAEIVKVSALPTNPNPRTLYIIV